MAVNDGEKERSIKVLEDLIRDIKKESMHILYVAMKKTIEEGPPEDGFKTYRSTGELSITIHAVKKPLLDKSDKADAERFRYFISWITFQESGGNLYFIGEGVTEEEKDKTRRKIDEAIQRKCGTKEKTK